MDTLGKQYGYNKSVFEALEELAVACLANNMSAPTAIVFKKEDLEKLTAKFTPKEKIATNSKPSYGLDTIVTSAGRIELKEDKNG